MRRTWLASSLLAVSVLAGSRVMAASLVEQNVVDLLRQSDAIAVGTVVTVADGIDDQGIPYTEVTMNVSESIRGVLPEVYTFRQFGLMTSRPTPDGKMVMMPAPEGFPRYASGEHVLMFFYPRAQQTGLRTTAGLMQGKFTLRPGSAMNGTGNVGLFRNVQLDSRLAQDSDRRLLATQSGAVNPEALLTFVRRAVQGRWIEAGRLASRAKVVR